MSDTRMSVGLPLHLLLLLVCALQQWVPVTGVSSVHRKWLFLDQSVVQHTLGNVHFQVEVSSTV